MTPIISNSVWSDAERAAWRLRGDRNVWQWADAERVLPDDSAEPGPYRSARVPYMRGPQEAFTDDEVEEITVMAAAQTTKTTILENMIGYAICEDPGPWMHVVAREEDVDYAAQHRIKPMIVSSPAVRAHWSGSPRDLQGTVFNLDNMQVYFTWAGSAPGLAAKNIRYLSLDEPDKYPAFAGREANPVALAEKRVTTFWDSKIIKVCTPTTKLAYTWRSWSLSNMQQDWIPCPRCGEYQVWVFVQLRVPPKLRDPERIIELGSEAVWYECKFCNYKMREEQKDDLVAAGKWLAEGQTIDADDNIGGRALRGRRHCGFQLSALISPFPKVTWSRIMAGWFKANTEEGIALGDRMDFENSILGWPHTETGKKIKASGMRGLKAEFSKGTVPDWVRILVASGDYHKSLSRGIVRINYEIRGFGYDLRNALIASGALGSFDELDNEVLLSPFPWSDGTAPDKKAWLAVIVLLIDSAFESDEVYNYCRRRPGLTIPCRGVPTFLRAPIRVADLEQATERRLKQRQRRRYRGMQLIEINTGYFKDQVTSWAEPKRDNEGKIIAEALTSFYAETPEYYFREFCNEEKVKQRDRAGNVKWIWQPVKAGAPTHSLDTAVYSAAAGYYKGVFYMKDPKKTPPPAAGARRVIGRRRIGRIQR